ncbi:MAG: adenine phosphoribosyltransferase [Acidobacteria bacterium]|nr:MAG: adenine phosphoribosyltransferase [Acidobacteriota bacterium]
MRVAALKSAIRDVPDFPKQGIVFKDITTLLKDARLFREAMDLFTDLCQRARPDKVVAIESRGFIFGAVLADRLGAGFVPVRKKGKLPGGKIAHTYDLEYGTDCLEIHEDALQRGERTLVVDDVLATGGTAAATGQLVGQLGAELAGYAFLVELTFLKGRDKLQGNVFSLLRY